ncbi:MAG: metallophosphoesterase [Gemmatimonadales bacterium]
MIGPLFRARRLLPRSSANPPGLRRRVRNRLTDVFEYCVAPFANWEKERLVTEHVEIRLEGLGAPFAGYRIAFLTDLHISPLVPRWWLDRAVRAALALEPQLIVLGGDYIDDDPHYVHNISEVLRPLRALDGVVGVLGNHDHYVDAPGVREQLKKAGVRELLNEPIIVKRGGSELAITGVGDLERDVIDFDRALAGVAGDVPRIALSHWPDVFAHWPAELRLDLMLAGHTHGGQAFLPILGPPWVPSQFGFRYLAGHIREGKRQLYVSRGVGASGVPFRWGCPPELTLLVLAPAGS